MSDPGLTRLIAPEAIMAGGGFKISWRLSCWRSGQCWMDPLTGIIHESPWWSRRLKVSGSFHIEKGLILVLM